MEDEKLRGHQLKNHVKKIISIPFFLDMSKGLMSAHC